MTYNNEEDSLPVLIYLKQMFVAINASENYRDFFPTPEIEDYFMDQFFGSAVRALLDKRNFHNKEMEELSHAIIRESVILFPKTI